MEKNKIITKLNELGQSIWYDNLSRDVLNSGELKGLIDQGISGLTSNPTIFQNAIVDTDTYDQKIKELKDQGLSPEQVIEELMIADVADAADLLLPIYQASGGSDGFASIEVSPRLAHDTENTVKEAKRLWEKLARPNIMIKIPATSEGLPAIRQTLSAGINVNVTLIFSLEFYQQVMDTYVEVLEERLAKGESINSIASVASFFISRNDAWMEKKFEAQLADNPDSEQERENFFGKVGLANGFGAYQVFQETFGSERFAKLSQAGAQIQKILWASTGVKNPSLDPNHYSLGLPFKSSVATHPPQLLSAMMELEDSSNVVENADFDVNAVYSVYDRLSLSLDDMFSDLIKEGVEKFVVSYDDLVSAVK